MEAVYFILAVYFAFGYAIERERRSKAEKRIHQFYNGVQECQKSKRSQPSQLL